MQITEIGKGALRLSGSVGASDGPDLIEAIQTNQTHNMLLERPEEPEPQALLDVLKQVSDWMGETRYPDRIAVWVGEWVGERSDLFDVLAVGLGPDSRIQPMTGWYGAG